MCSGGGSGTGDCLSRPNDPLEQRRRLDAHLAVRAPGDEEAHPLDEGFLPASVAGPPSGPCLLKVGRLGMMLTGEESIREVIPFPALRWEG